MYLRQIELENFKSFGKKLTVPLLEGYTAVTGPNGSGKSNISDAILFVLGPKSSRAIRAGKLSDLIFNGGKDRSPASYCKVSLVFDNRDRTIPIDEDMVRLTRVIKMSQDRESYTSTFYVNDRRSSLGEFDVLLSNARISADGYNFVQQGDITRITTMSNLERRRIFDDISGISKFDEEISKARAERDEVDANIERISIILAELERQIGQLEQEKEVALTYLRMKEKLTLSRAQLAYRRRESYEAEAAALHKQIETYEHTIQQLKDQRLEVADRIRDLDVRMMETEKELREKGGREFQELRRRSTNCGSRWLRQRIARPKPCSPQRRPMRNAPSRRPSGRICCGPWTKWRRSVRRHPFDSRRSMGQLESRNKELAAIQAELSDCDAELATLEKELASLDREVRQKDDELNRLRMEKERLEGRRDRLADELAEFDRNMESLDVEVLDADEQIKELKRSGQDSSRSSRSYRRDSSSRGTRKPG